MNEFSLLHAIGLLLSAVVGAALVYLKYRSTSSVLEERNRQLSNQLDHLKENLRVQNEDLKLELQATRQEREKIRNEKELLGNQLVEKNTQYQNLEDKMQAQAEDLEKLQQKFYKDFENLANNILDQKSQKFTSLNKENIENILGPLQEKIKSFEERVDKNAVDFVARNAELEKHLQILNEQNLRISAEATNLTKALKGESQTQGSWGEMILESVLQKSGLRKDFEYSTQENFQDAEGKRYRPDVIVHLPGDKKLIIDSKVSLSAYERYCSEDQDKDLKEKHIKEHLRSINSHVQSLSSKNYQQLYQEKSPDFVLLFIPVEAAFALASQRSPDLYSQAFEKNIILVTPTTLLAVLRTIDSIWQNEKQKKNALEIAKQAGALYDAFIGLTDELLKLGRQLGTIQNSYEGTMKKLQGKGNLIRRVEKLRKLGAKASKQLDQQLQAQEEDMEELILLEKDDLPQTDKQQKELQSHPHE